MRLEGTIHCDGPDCERSAHVSTSAMEAGRLCIPFRRLIEYGDAGDHEWAFCGYDCLMKWAAQWPAEQIIYPGDPMPPQPEV